MHKITFIHKDSSNEMTVYCLDFHYEETTVVAYEAFYPTQSGWGFSHTYTIDDFHGHSIEEVHEYPFKENDVSICYDNPVLVE